jgi:NADH-quinone oxidoreductase subunit M
VGLGLSTVTTEGLSGAVFQMFAHGIMTALLFSSLGYLYDRTHTKLIPDLGGMSKVMPVASGYFIVAALAGMGVPGFASFWAEVTVFISVLKVYPVLGVLSVCTLVLSALYMLRVVQRTFYGQRNKRYAHLSDVSFGLGLPRMILIATLVLFGLLPRLMLDLLQSAVIPFMGGLAK